MPVTHAITADTLISAQRLGTWKIFV